MEKSKFHSYPKEGQEGRCGELRVGQPHLNLSEGDEGTNLGKHFQHMKDKNVIGSSQHRFMKGNLLKFNKVKCAPEEEAPHGPVHTGAD